MFTQCPDCGTAFRVTADVLKQAAGKVRCGGCGNAFNALMYLSETRPEAKPREDVDESLPELIPEPPDGGTLEAPRKISAEQSAALLKTLDQLAGEDIQLEDTGVEWRLLGDDDEDAGNDSSDDFDDEPLDAGSYEVEESDAIDSDTLDVALDDDADGLFSETSVNDTSVNEVFADARTAVDAELSADTGASHIDELLDDAPTPVDQFLTHTPNNIEAEEVFTESGEDANLDAREVFADNGGGADVEASEVFGTPAPVRADELRFDDNTGLPDNFDFDNITAAEPPAKVFDDTPDTADDDPDMQSDAEQERFETEFEIGDEDEWGALLEEVEPAIAAASDTPTDDAPADAADEFSAEGAAEWLADDAPDTKIALADADEERAAQAVPAQAVASSAAGDEAVDAEAFDEPAVADQEADSAEQVAEARPLTLEEELAALPDDPDDDADDGEALAADEAVPPPATTKSAPVSDVSGIDFSGIYAITPETALEFEAEEAGLKAGDETTNEPDDATAIHDPEDEEAGLAFADGDDPSVVLDQQLDVIPNSTSELEFELIRAQQSADADVELDPEHVVAPPTPEEQTVNMLIDEDLMRLAIPDDDGMASTIVLEGKSVRSTGTASGENPVPGPDAEPVEVPEDTTGFESIIMEGDFVRTALEQERLAAEAEARGDKPADIAAQVAANAAQADEAHGGRSRKMQYGLVAGIVVLVLLLAGQFVHQSRAELATIPAVGNTIGPIYRAVGAPISPDWDVKGWRFDKSYASTNPDGLAARLAGTTDAVQGDEQATATTAGGNVLTIYSLLSNKSESNLPYPLISVSLLDRFEEPVGSKVYGPKEYLKGKVDASRLIAAGASFEAVIAIASPSANLDNFKLNACYRQASGQLRCAFEDFK